MVLILLFLFLVISTLVHFNLFSGVDMFTTVLLQTVLPRNFDTALSVLSLILSSEVSAVILVIIAGLVFIKFRQIFLGLGTIIFIYGVELFGKNFILHPGPPDVFFRYSIPFWFPSAYVKTMGSFPSGHVSRAFFFTVIIIFLTKKFNLSINKTRIITLFIIIFAAAMMISRIYLGEHWLSDTLGGLLLGTSVGLIATTITNYDFKKFK